MPDHHWIQILKTSYDTLSSLILSRLAQPSDRELCGIKDGGTWKLTSQAAPVIVSDECLSIAGRLVEAQVSHLPAHAYRALIAGSPSFTQFGGVDDLYRQVRQPPEDWRPAGFARLLEESVQAGRRPDPRPRLVVTPTTYEAEWKADEVYLRRDEAGDWFLALMFEVRHLPGLRHVAPVPVGLDLGLRPMTVARTGAGETRTFQSCDITHLRAVTQLDLTPEARCLLASLAYASGRQDSQRVIAYLNWRANRVYAEQLRLDDMNLGYVQMARATAIHDHHFSHLPQFMYAARHQFKRVPSWKTSVRCARCYMEDRVTVYGDRQSERLTCRRCKRTYDANKVAAQNVLLIGEERYARGKPS